VKITIFSEELRKCLNAAGLSDCGENDTWNYWYQRLMNAYNESVERQIMTEQADNAKLWELCVSMYEFSMSEYPDGTELNYADRMRELGVDV
jgi:hypothetical protein